MPDTRGGVVLQIDPVAPDAGISRSHPCQVQRGSDGLVCKATPARLCRRVCLHKHTRDAWVCATHQATIKAAAFGGTCHQCATDSTHAHLCPIELIDVEAVIR